MTRNRKGLLITVSILAIAAIGAGIGLSKGTPSTTVQTGRVERPMRWTRSYLLGRHPAKELATLQTEIAA
jgi:hypothetical protein